VYPERVVTIPDFAAERYLSGEIEKCIRFMHFVLGCGEPIGPIEDEIREWMKDADEAIPYDGCYCGRCEAART
jgi:hypothetical protein